MNPVQTSCPPITDRAVSRDLLYISGRQALQTSIRRGFHPKMETLYNFSEENEDIDQILNQAYDQFEVQYGGAATSGPLFKFRLRQIGKRRQWRDVVQRQQFDAQLIQLRDARPDDNIGNQLTEALYQTIETELIRQNRPTHDFINFAITANGFSHAYQTINFNVEEFLNRTARLDTMLSKLAGKLNSNESFKPSEGFSVDVVFVRMPGKGKGRKKNNPGQRCMDNENKKKRCIIAINNQDDLCCARAIVTMREHCNRDNSNDAFHNFHNMRRGRVIQEHAAIELHRLAGVDRGPCGTQELEKFQQYLQPTYQLLVICRSRPFFPIFRGPPAPKQIRLLKSDTHYDGCTSFPAFLNRSYWCDLCGKGFDHDDAKHHPCEGRSCHSCNRKECPDYDRTIRVPPILCNFCHCRFYGNNCFDYHRQKNLCQTHKTCEKCHAEYNVVKGKRHRCGLATCPSCKELVEIHAHKCYIQPVVEHPEEEDVGDDQGKKKPLPPPLLVYADIEAMMLPDRQFEPNLLCYRTSESVNIVTHKGKNCICTFLHDLDDAAEIPDDDRQRTIITIFHNLKGFDGIFIIDEIYKQQRSIENQLTVGSKVLSFESGPLLFKDSLCFLPMPLAAFPSTFNLTELKKGFFPHLFNTPDNQEYKGRIPDLEYYDPDGLSDKKKNQLQDWHAEQVRRGVPYDFAKEMEQYCKSDVALLQAGCEAFTQEFTSRAGFNPFEKCVTIASACNLYWRRHHLKQNTIAVEPLRGWRGSNVNNSLKALRWLYYQEQQIPKEGASADRILHVRNGGEQSVRTSTTLYFVDGYDPHSNTVYEFYGCFWHGCPRCHPGNRHTKHAVNADRTIEELWRATQAKENALRNHGYNLEVMWEHDWDKLCQDDANVKDFVTTLQLVEPLQPRNAFFGGRTGTVTLHAVASEGEEIRYVDITSLYPWVNKNAVYPIGHPTIITQPRIQDIANYFGIALVDILAPSNLFHPVLPVRSGEKLTFPLCASCVKEEQAKPMLQRTYYCQHTDAERMLRGTWCTPEIIKAVEKGYRVVQIHEVWHFQKQQEGLFRDYVNTWLTLKQQAAGWPPWCVTEQKKQQYISEYREREGIDLDYNSIKKNAGKKATAKLMLNSFWGKFGERPNKPRTDTITSPSQLFPLLFHSHKNVSTLRICNEDILEVVSTDIDDNVVPSNKTNVFIAAFTTAWARLRLYEALDKLQQQVLYYDTDSVIYRWKEGQAYIPVGDYLGQFTDELEGDIITEFISGGAKNYGYKTRGGNCNCKIRGFTLNVRGKELLNFETMKRNILAEIHDPQEERRVIRTVNPNHFQRDTTHKKIKLVEQVKKYKLVFDKRVLDPQNKMSYPFGYRDWSEVDDDNVNMLLDL